METLTVKQFCERYKNLKSDEAKKRYVESIIKRTYAPYMEKMMLCKQMAEKSVRITPQGSGYLDMCANQLNFTGVIIVLYTTLTYDKNEDGKPDVAGCYDALNESKTIDNILSLIGSDLDELLVINKSCLDAAYAEYCSSEVFWSRQFDKIGVFMGAFEGMMSEVISASSAS